jgi:formylglycine-generating enzyme
LYPWEGLYLSNSKGCYLANFKVQRGDYIADNYTYTGPTQGYWPNDFGLYDMSGNVAEWCEDDFDEKAYSKTFDMNPLFRYDPRSTPAQLKFQRKVVRGGSWKDIGYFLAVGTRGYEYAETSKSYIGFRCVVSVLGPSGASLQP